MKIELTRAEFNQIVGELAEILNADLCPMANDATPKQVLASWREQAPAYVERHVAMSAEPKEFYESCVRYNDRTARLLSRLLSQAA